MFLSKLRIRGKLALLAAIPLLAVLGLMVPVLLTIGTNAADATQTAQAAGVAGQVGPLLQDLQRERLLSVGYVLGVVDAGDLGLETSAVNDRLVDLRQDLPSDAPEGLRAALDKVTGLASLRQKVLAKAVSPEDVIDRYVDVLDGMIDALALLRHADLGTAAGRQLVALDALLRMDESNTESTALLAIMSAGNVNGLFVRYHEERTEYETYLDRFTAMATDEQNSLYGLVAAAFDDRVGANFDSAFDVDPVKTMSALPIAGLFPTLNSFTVLGTFVEKRLVADVTTLVSKERRTQVNIAYGVGSGTLVVLVLVVLLVITVARAVAVPLRQLTRSAERVAEAGETELARVADDEAESAEPVHLDVLDVSTNDEIGELARAFDRVQSTATQLVERQVFSRRNFAEMFGHIGRRTQNLVGRQVDLIDRLEMEETEPQRLQQLYRLDHMSNRLRRSADSLVVISGADRADQHTAPVRLIDVVRLALAEIEDYTRVDVDVPAELTVLPAVVGDLVLLCAELLENATNFSPPHTRVEVGARPSRDGARLVVTDHGIGLPEERMAEENARIARRERLDLVPTKVLGLFVVGRLARRHGFGAVLSTTPGGGLTATVDLGFEHLAGRGAPVPVVVEAIIEEPVRTAARRHGGPAVPGVAELEAMIAVPQLEARHTPVYRSEWNAEEPVPPRPYESPYAADPVLRASSRVRDWRPWNAFEVKPRLLPAEPAQQPPPPAAYAASPPAAYAASPPAAYAPPPAGYVAPPPAAYAAPPPAAYAAPPAAAMPAVASATPALPPTASPPPAPSGPPPSRMPTAPVSMSGLRQRVPGAQLPTTSATGAQAEAPAVTDAAAARELMEAFESGVRRAQHVAGDRPPAASEPLAAPESLNRLAPPTWPLPVDPLPDDPASSAASMPAQPPPQRSTSAMPSTSATSPSTSSTSSNWATSAPSAMPSTSSMPSPSTSSTSSNWATSAPSAMPSTSSMPSPSTSSTSSNWATSTPSAMPSTSSMPSPMPSTSSTSSSTPSTSAGGGLRPLSRRVPGAALTAMDPQPNRAAPARQALGQDPDVVRNLVEQFESGVARALRDTTEGANSEEGTRR